MVIRYMSLSAEPNEHKFETAIGTYQSINKNQIEDDDIRVKNVLPEACVEHVPKFRFMGIPCWNKKVSKNENLFDKLAYLLTVYQLVFS